MSEMRQIVLQVERWLADRGVGVESLHLIPSVLRHEHEMAEQRYFEQESRYRELVEALEALLRDYAQDCPGLFGGDRPRVPPVSIAQAQAALAKARGETPDAS